ncbi:hypothetical protein AVEN_112485-1 [Araneus ventricosus]|uniref:Uncharacterized protein n=1 Tax=Araneus ventricosus TaxID=182803 RepID=A0A4Y2UUR8_ARAVE|nr:hypothetical protein AVEN_112485-1 [Araneus ventricosus]
MLRNFARPASSARLESYPYRDKFLQPVVRPESHLKSQDCRRIRPDKNLHPEGHKFVICACDTVRVGQKLFRVKNITAKTTCDVLMKILRHRFP